MPVKKFYISMLLIMFGAKLIESFTNESQQKITLSITEKLFIKNFIVIKHPSFHINKETILLTKFLSKSNKFISILSVAEMNFEVRNSFAFSKTMVLLNEENLFECIHELLTKNEFSSRRYVWFVLSNLIENTISIKDGAYIPYHAQFLIAKNISKENFDIFEIYHPQMNSSVIYKQKFGSMQADHGLEIVESDFYQRRLNVNETMLYVRFDSLRHRTKWFEFFEIICKTMNFRLALVPTEDYKDKDKQDILYPWEILFQPTTIDSIVSYDNFILGMMWKTEYSLYVKYQTVYEDQNLLLYLRPFSINLWLAMLIHSIIFIIFTLLIIFIKTKFGMKEDFNILNIVLNFFEAFLNQSGDEDSKSLSSRSLAIATRITALFIVPAYSGAILSFILIPKIKLPFTDVKGIVEDGSFKVSFAENNLFYKWFNQTEDPWSKEIYKRFLINYEDLPETAYEELQDMCKMDKIVFIFTEDITSLANCKVLKIPKPLGVAWHGLLLRLESSYKFIFNRILKTIISSGVLDKNLKDYTTLVSVFEMKIKKEKEEDGVMINNIASIFQLMGILYSLAILIFLLEWICYRKFPFSGNLNNVWRKFKFIKKF